MSEEAPPTPAEAPEPVQADAEPKKADVSLGEGPGTPVAVETAVAMGNPEGVPQTPPVATAGVPQTPPAADVPAGPAYRPNYIFLAVVSVVSLALDLGTKAWAKARLDDAKEIGARHIVVLQDHLSFRFAQNQGGAWGLLQDEPESVRRPFFLGISFLAIAFIVSLYRKLTPQQWALKWGLPLVLGGALGNLVNRIQFNYVVDFIDFKAGWVKAINGLISQHPSDHWPVFNIADVAIVAGVVLMAVDMFTPRKKTALPPLPPPAEAVTMGNPEGVPQTPPTMGNPEGVPQTPPAPPAPPPAPKET